MERTRQGKRLMVGGGGGGGVPRRVEGEWREGTVEPEWLGIKKVKVTERG